VVANDDGHAPRNGDGAARNGPDERAGSSPEDVWAAFGD
jgi:hypothetical protein